METLPQGQREGRLTLKSFPDTTTEKGADRPSPVLAVVGLGVLLLAAAVSLWPDDFSPGEALISPGAQDIAVSLKDTTYPDTDALRFDGRPEAIYVYVRVEDLDDGDLEASVGRTAKNSVVGRVMGDGGIRIVDRSEEPLGASGGGVSGVLKFALRPASGGRLPAGDYTVEVFERSVGGGVVARKYFVVGGWQG